MLTVCVVLVVFARLIAIYIGRLLCNISNCAVSATQSKLFDVFVPYGPMWRIAVAKRGQQAGVGRPAFAAIGHLPSALSIGYIVRLKSEKSCRLCEIPHRHVAPRR